MSSSLRGFGRLLQPVQRRLARVDLQEHEDKILLLLALVIGAVVGLIVVAFVALTERMGRVLLAAGGVQRFLSPVLGSLVGGWLLFRFFPDARGSGIPQTRVALLLQNGVISLRTVVGLSLIHILVRRMRLTGDDELHWALRIGQQAKQALWVVQEQVWSLVGREAASKAQRQGIGIEEMLRGFDVLGRRACCGQVPGQPFASVLDKRLTGRGAKLPELGVGDPANVLLQSLSRPQPAILSTGFGPKIVSRGRVPGGRVDSVSHMSDRDFVFRPAREQRQKKVPAYLPVQAAYIIHRPAPPD